MNHPRYSATLSDMDFAAVRDAVTPLPDSEPAGYRRVLLLGTTGPGKMTLVRQLIGTDPEKERYPSTSAAQTTIHDTEIIIAEGDCRAVVTFVSRDEVREYVTECVSNAVIAETRGGDDSGLARDPIDMTNAVELLAGTIETLRGLASRHRDRTHAHLEVNGDDDEHVAATICEEELDNVLRDNEAVRQLADVLMEEIQNRFEVLPTGDVRSTHSADRSRGVPSGRPGGAARCGNSFSSTVRGWGTRPSRPIQCRPIEIWRTPRSFTLRHDTVNRPLLAHEVHNAFQQQ